jgi:predicted nucleic-acid-binding protein
MIGVDTNVVLRLFVVDDEEQHRRAVAFFSARSIDDPAYVNLLVVAELTWLLHRRYRFSRTQLLDVLRALAGSVNVEIEARDLVEDAIAAAAADSNAGIADLLIALTNTRAGCAATVSFGKDAAKRISGMELVS